MLRFSNIWILFIFMVAGCPALIAQKLSTVSGKAQIRLEDNMSLDEAKANVRQQAIINAIEDAYGTYVEQDASSYIENGKTSFRIIGNTRVKGEWLRTLDESFSEFQKKIKGTKPVKKETWISCEIRGEAREVTRPSIDFKFLPLNCTDPACRTYDFENGEPFYLYFNTPREGYLNIYMSQEDGKVYRLLPYKAMNHSYPDGVPVKPDSEYIFFAPGEKFNYFADLSYQAVDEMIMEASEDKEVMNLYVVFSPEKFDKPGLVRSDAAHPDVPDYLSEREFNEWLEENRIYNPDFDYRTVSLTVKK